MGIKFGLEISKYGSYNVGKSVIFILLVVCWSCGQTTNESAAANQPPEENRFIQEIFVSGLFEPTELVVLPDNKILYTQRRGGIKQYDLAKKQLINYDSLPVYYENEDGLLGIALDPGFESNRWVYMYYSPVGERPVNRLSRFNYTSSGLKNEVVVLEVDVQRDECCHTGGSVQFGGDGLLYLSTGDNTNPFASDGFGPIDERSGRSAWDAQKSSANTNDLRGKILRIKPESDGTYSIPPGNLFEDDDPLTRPEIYVMGCRNPYRISVDAERGWLFWGDVGPDANEDRETRGPKGHDEFNVATGPGFFGWPLFVADNKAYNEFDFATGSSGDRYDPKNPVNNSPNNTGRNKLPPAQPAKIYYPYAKSPLFPQVGSGGRNAMAGPVYYADNYTGLDKFPAFFDGRVFYFDWMRGFIYSLQLDEDGNPVDWYPFMPGTEFNNLMDMEFGPDGQLYLIEYGTGWFTQNDNAKLSRVTYVSGNRTPVLNTELSAMSGAAPLTVEFDASGSVDYDGDKLSYRWEIGEEVFKEPKFSYTFEREGVYYPEVTLSDPRGNKVNKQFSVEVGNDPPRVEIVLDGNSTFFWPGRKIQYQVTVNDLEDGSLGKGIAPDQVNFSIEHFASSDMAESLGHKQPVSSGLKLIESLDCKACHKINDKSIGPSYTQVAEQYANDRAAVNYLMYKIINGGGGVWGEQAMSAHPDLSTKDAESIVTYILSLSKINDVPLAGSYITDEPKGNYLFRAEYTDSGKAPLKPITEVALRWLAPSMIPAVEFDKGYEVKIREREGRVSSVNSIFHESWIAFEHIDLTGISAIRIHFEDNMRGGEILLRSGSEKGKELGRISAFPGKENYQATIRESGVHDLYFVFSNPEEKNQFFAIQYIEFIPKPDLP